MVAPRSLRPRNTPPSLARRLAWPATIACVIGAIAACGGSSEGWSDPKGAGAGSGGALGVSGSTSTLGGRHNSGSAGSSGSSSSASAGKQAAGGEYALGGEGPMGPEDGGEGPIGPGGAPGMPGMPHEPPKPPGGMGGAGGAGPDCPDEPPTDKAECTTKLKCDYPKLACNCDGPEADRTWKCKEPPKPMTMCPPMAPAEGSACKSKEPAAPPCHYEEPVADCNCVNDEWTCAK